MIFGANDLLTGNEITVSDCNPGIEFSIPASGIGNFVIPGSRDSVSGLRSQSKEWDFSAHEYFIHQTAKILISII